MAAAEVMGKTSMAVVVGRGASTVGKMLVVVLAAAVVAATSSASALASAALASIVGQAGLVNFVATGSRLDHLALCNTSNNGGDLATAA